MDDFKTRMCSLVLVETDEQTSLSLDTFNMLFNCDSRFTFKDCKNQQLILISTEPYYNIQPGDKVLCTINNKITKCRLKQKSTEDVKSFGMNVGSIDTTDYYFGDSLIPSLVYNYKKIIATQEQLPNDYIQRFIQEYNSENVKDVEVEVFEDIVKVYDNIGGHPGGHWESNGFKPKLTHGRITIVDKKASIDEKITYWVKNMANKSLSESMLIENVKWLLEKISYSEEEVESLCKTSFEMYMSNDSLTDDELKIKWKTWFEQNKKK
jgi:hypothetical protein